MITSCKSTVARASASLLQERSPTIPRAGRGIPVFGTVLTPDHFRRRATRLVSCYAMFKWWLPLSQHPSCKRDPTSFVTEHGLGALDGDLGCFPFDDGTYLPPSNSHWHSYDIRSLPGVSTPLGAIGQTVLYLRGASARG